MCFPEQITICAANNFWIADNSETIGPKDEDGKSRLVSQKSPVMICLGLCILH